MADVERVGPVEKRNPKTLQKWVWMTVSTATATVIERQLTVPFPCPSQGFNDRKKRKPIDLKARVKRGRDGKLTYDEAQLGKRKVKESGESSASGKKRGEVCEASEAGPSNVSSKRTKR